MGSSGGTFINQKKLSNPNTQSKKWPIKLLDVVRLGSDFHPEGGVTVSRPAERTFLRDSLLEHNAN